MSLALPSSRLAVGRTFVVAVWVLGIVAVVQLGLVTWQIVQRTKAGAGVAASAAAPGTADGVETREITDPFAEDAAGLARSPAAVPPKPTPISLDALRPSPTVAPADPADRFQELIDHARLLRERGDVYAAITKLREAQAVNNQSPVATAELAMTYEQQGNGEKAAEAWRRVYEMGAAAGVYYAAAEAKLKASQVQAMRQLEMQNRTAPATTPAPGAAPNATPAPGSAEQPAFANPATVAAALGQVGQSSAAKLQLNTVFRQEQPEALMARKFVLHVPVKVRSRARVDAREVVVQVHFYDTVNGRVERTGAQLVNQWENPPADWSEDETETLLVTYSLPSQRVSDEERNYYGYLVTVYYKNALQDYRSDPPALAEQAPPAKTLEADSTP